MDYTSVMFGFLLGSAVTFGFVLINEVRHKLQLGKKVKEHINTILKMKEASFIGYNQGLITLDDAKKHNDAFMYALRCIINNEKDVDITMLNDFVLKDEEVELLKQYSKVFLHERKKDFTSLPLVKVVDQKWVMTASECGERLFYRCKTNEDQEIYETQEELLKFVQEHEADLDIIGGIMQDIQEHGAYYARGFWIESIPVRRQFNDVAYFITLKEAAEYIEYQKHNLKEPSIVSCHLGHGNKGELPVMLHMLLRLGSHLNQEKVCGNEAQVKRHDSQKES